MSANGREAASGAHFAMGAIPIFRANRAQFLPQ